MGMNRRAATAAWGLACCAVAGSASTASAQSQAHGAADSAFVQKAASGGMAEVQLGQEAQKKSTNADVKQFGQRMVTDHGKANKQLATAAQNAGITVPQKMMPKHQKTVSRLSSNSAETFDSAYMAVMLKDHTEDVALFRKESESGGAESLRSFAKSTLPVLEEHLRMARATAAKVGVDTAGATAQAAGGDSAR